MDFDISRPGLYYLLNPPAGQMRIRDLGIASRVCFEKGEPDEIIRRRQLEDARGGDRLVHLQ